MKFLCPCAALALLSAATVAQAEVYYTSNVLKDAVTPMQPLARGAVTHLSGMTDDDQPLTATFDINADGAIATLTVAQNGVPLTLPDGAWSDVSSADIAWLEERGALSTVVVEGWSTEGKRWRLALEFHPKQLWKRRFSVEGERRDLYTFYDRKDMTPSQPKRRGSGSKGLYWRD